MTVANKAKFTKGHWKMHSRSEVRFGGCGLISICNANNVEEYHNTALISSAPDMYNLLSTIENDDGIIPAWLWDKIQITLAKARGE